MRSFESYLAFACVLAVLWPALFGVRSRRGFMAAILLVALVVQWRVEGYRWPLLPLYLLAVGLAVGDVVSLERHLQWFRRAGRAVFGLIGIGLVVAPALMLPVPQIPQPSGPMQIGTTMVELRHPDLVEEYGPSPGGRRRIATQVWYPAEPAEDAEPLPWEPEIDLVGSALAGRMGVPGFFFNSARHTTSHSYLDAPLAEGGFPLVVFSHSWEGFRKITLPQVENLVSQGYVVIAIDHAYASVATVIDGEAVMLDEDALGAPEATDDQVAEATAALVGTLAADISLVLDEVGEGPDGEYGNLAGSIDGEVVGLWGHGLGGGAALQVCNTDERCDAVAAFDPWVEILPDPVLAATATNPMLLMRSDPWRDTVNDDVLRGIVARSETISYWVGVFGADTSDFLAMPLVSPVASNLGLRGPIDGDLVQVINRRFLTGFFDRFLLGTGAAALDTANFAEVDIQVIDERSE